MEALKLVGPVHVPGAYRHSSEDREVGAVHHRHGPTASQQEGQEDAGRIGSVAQGDAAADAGDAPAEVATKVTGPATVVCAELLDVRGIPATSV